ncbi:MinD/ParA family protein [Pseudodesulfovibrio senegalensis]|jgi:flagellar biosynthesis protein FlhG|uniref:MinD/ParA family protein n=1 Tax=Pseudodesulfovibrio senegalensis TaxID=1721087 RepID=A0A6N6N6V8_9BACT|nr:MinD/ParA family protein [Pseudodesulfovibrio senegalensis]KAB1443766.1 MinD/ParA family protein [Pseudodesulfovibrio senegalensis]
MSDNQNNTLSVSILSGKGGVGKSNIVLNLGYALYMAQKTAMLMDCDLGLANLDVLLGISPEMNLQDLLNEDTPVDDVLVAIEDDGLDILPATSGVPELVEMDEDMREILFKKLVSLAGDYNFLLLDLGAGISPTVMAFASTTQLRLMVVTPEPTSLTDSYAVIKVLATQYDIKDFLVLVNQATSQSEAKTTFDRLNAACRNFLGIDLVFLGHIEHDPMVIESVRRQTPLMKMAPNSLASKDIKLLAKRLMRYREDNAERIAERPILKKFPDPR